ncbi:cell wall hydrolase [Sphingomonas sp. SRS2]|uniref:cell wall hydrolase n=1 Tax=Sphingomonas sp. SRS2 TaxID=133190 RepID=UPI0006184897|nr:cell wall hydrolase [Sphingomonas sp. SRS2]KKC25678.1 cell wall hydrolase [Sphingomonas sp. SRS2]
MSAKLAQHPLMIAAMIFAAATGAMGFAAIPTSEPALAYDMSAQITADELVVDDGIDKVLFKEAVIASSQIDKQLECMAKVVMHEAANQPRSGQLAVAQLIMNRVGQDRFGETVCQVVNQPGQFFNTNSYNPPRASSRWATAIEVSRQAMAGHGEQIVPGAVFYHAAYQAPNRFFKTRERISMVGDHVFYR